MKDFREQDFYELLDLSPRATAEEVELRYQTVRRVLSPDSVATYALFQGEELDLLRRRIEEAYRVLSQPERRQAYDRDLERVRGGFLPPAGSAAPAPAAEPASGREPAAPSAPECAPAPADAEPAIQSPAAAPAPSPPPASPPAAAARVEAEESPPASGAGCPQSAPTQPPPPDIGDDTVFTGELLRSLREARGLSLERVSELTKINLFYLRAIEQDAFANFPAEVYVRGYLRLLACVYRVPVERLVASYLSRVSRVKD
jgi:curved DNA-binding protein CbpA